MGIFSSCLQSCFSFGLRLYLARMALYSWVLWPSHSHKDFPGRWRTWVQIHSSWEGKCTQASLLLQKSTDSWGIEDYRRKRRCREPCCWIVVRHFQEYEARDKSFQDCQCAFSCLNPIQVSFWVWCIFLFGPQSFCISKNSYSDWINSSEPAKHWSYYGDNLGSPK